MLLKYYPKRCTQKGINCLPTHNSLTNIRIDTYSFALILWQCLTRKELFVGYAPNEIIPAILEEQLRPEIPSDAPAVLQVCIILKSILTPTKRIIETSWAHNPEERPPFEKLAKILGQPLQAILQYSAPGGKKPETPKPIVHPNTPSPSASVSTSASTKPEPAQSTTEGNTQFVVAKFLKETDEEYEDKLNQIIGRIRDYLSSPSDLGNLILHFFV
jgi:hypothetical protein